MKRDDHYVPGHSTADLRDQPTSCPYCGHRVRGATNPTPGDPTLPGDPDVLAFSLCVKCGELGLFTPELTLRKPTPEELAGLHSTSDWPVIHRMQVHIKSLRHSYS